MPRFFVDWCSFNPCTIHHGTQQILHYFHIALYRDCYRFHISSHEILWLVLSQRKYLQSIRCSIHSRGLDMALSMGSISSMVCQWLWDGWYIRWGAHRYNSHFLGRHYSYDIRSVLPSCWFRSVIVILYICWRGPSLIWQLLVMPRSAPRASKARTLFCSRSLIWYNFYIYKKLRRNIKDSALGQTVLNLKNECVKVIVKRSPKKGVNSKLEIDRYCEHFSERIK